MAPGITIHDIAVAKRPVCFTQPFRFGAFTVEGADEAFVHVEIDVEGFGRSRGAAAEMMMPKWFDKNPALSPEDTVAELQASLDLAIELYGERRAPETAFGLHAACYRPLIGTCAEKGIPPLAAVFGAAEIDKAVLDALLRAVNLDVFEGLSRNVMGLDPCLTPDLDAAAIATFLSSRAPRETVFVRHTIGLVDTMDSLTEAVRAQGLRYFKIKLGGDPEADRVRLIAIVRTLDAVAPDYRFTLDANEQYRDERALAALVDVLVHDEALQAAGRRLLYIEQPLPREATFAAPLGDAGRHFAFIVDEADSDYDAFRRAVALGYRGVSSKSCKGLYKSLLNGARAARWSSEGLHTFVAAEDLTCQAGLAVQQDTALVAFHGIAHCERNGHHYADGFTAAPAREAQAFLMAHPDLYETADGQVRLRVTDGAMRIGSLAKTTGFASGVDPSSVHSPSSFASKQVREAAS